MNALGRLETPDELATRIAGPANAETKELVAKVLRQFAEDLQRRLRESERSREMNHEA